MNNRNNKDEEFKGWQLSVLGLNLVVSTGIGFACGYWLDRKFNTAPKFTLALFAFGLLVGIWTLVKEILTMLKFKKPSSRK